MMTNYALGAVQLGLSGEDFGNGDPTNYDDFKKHWRGDKPLPDEATLKKAAADYLAKTEAADRIVKLRREIASNVAHPESLLGTVADGLGLLIAIAVADVVALSETTTFAAYKKAKLDTLKSLAGDADIAALADAALKQIQSGDVVLTARQKGVENVINESLDRSTQVARILSQAAKPNPQVSE